MHGTYDAWLVTFSIGVAIIASYVALDLVSRVAATRASKAAPLLARRRRGVDGDRHLVDALHRHARAPTADADGL
jgi:hypothetical protein